MPELVLEVLSEGNAEGEIPDRRALHLDEGAEEVWTLGGEAR